MSCMLLDAGRVNVMGHWVDRLVTEHQWETMLTIIQCAVFMVVCGFPLNVEMVERTFTHCACVHFDRRMGAEDVNRQLRLMVPECVERA